MPDFIEKWNVAFEDKEQQLQFAAEMKADIDKITAEKDRTIADLRRALSECKAKARIGISPENR